MGGVVPVFNLKGVHTGDLRFSGNVLADIYLGKIKKWNDPALKALNRKVSLPDTAITVVHRSDGSGTTFIFANYLSKVSAGWKGAVGEGTSVKWPAGVGGKGNEGVANYVSRIDGAIGYVEYAYAMQNGLSVGLLLNKEKEFAAPGEEAFKAAATAADWAKAPGMYLILTDQSGVESWPMTGASFILMHRIQDKPETAKEVLKFFDWAFQNGSKMAEDLDYVPMPAPVIELIRSEWRSKIRNGAGQPVYRP
jgi:phosphate transport system substrate-binding protein